MDGDEKWIFDVKGEVLDMYVNFFFGVVCDGFMLIMSQVFVFVFGFFGGGFYCYYFVLSVFM